MDMLYSAEMRGQTLESVLADEAARAAHEPERIESWRYAREIVLGVIEHRDEIDDLISSLARGWTLERMPAIDRALLRMGIWELRFNPEVPDAVAIAEAVEAAKEYSTDDSGRFIHGILGRVSGREVPAPKANPNDA